MSRRLTSTARVAHSDRLDRNEPVSPKGSSVVKAWRSQRTRTVVAVYTAVDAGLDTASPWYASCETHATALGCETKASALSAARQSDTFCDGCRS